MYIGDIAKIHMGLVLSRKKVKENSISTAEYKVLTLRSLSENGNIAKDRLAQEELAEVVPTYLTQENDIVVRLSEPNTAVYITKALEGIVITSYFCVIRINSDGFLPEYIAWYLGSDYAKRQLKKYLSGSTVPIIRKSELESVQVQNIPVAEQEKILKIDRLQKKEKALLYRLTQERSQLYRGAIQKILINRG